MTPPVAQALAQDLSEVISEDKELVLAFKKGELSAYDAIYQRHEARVHNVCRRMLSNPHDAQEAAQETFLRVYQALGRFNGRYQLGAWIGRIATNVCLDQIRSKGRKPVDAAPMEVIDAVSGVSDEDPESFIIRNAESRRVRRVLDSMAPLHRAAVVLRDFEGFSYEEIASTLKISEPQVKALIHRARKSFKRSWASSAAIFLPTRLFQKIVHKVRGIESTAVEHATQSVSSVQVMQSCSAALQHCGQVLADKVVAGAVATAVVMGAATGAVVTDRIKDARSDTVASVPSTKLVDASSAKKSKSVRTKNARKKGPVKSAAPITVEPAVEPEASPTPTQEAPPEPDPSPSDENGHNSNGQEAPPSDQGPKPVGPEAPPAFTAGLSFVRGGGSSASEVSGHEFDLDCTGGALKQSYNAPISDGSTIYNSFLDLTLDSDATQFELRIYPQGDKYGDDVRYESDSSTPIRLERVGDRLRFAVSGTYTNVDNDAGKYALPTSGTFDLNLETDCRFDAVVTETLGLG